MNRTLPAIAALLALAACDGNDSPRPGDEFVANRVVARVQKSESAKELKLDAPLMALHVTSVLDARRALTLVIGGDMMAADTFSASMPQMLEMLIPGPLTARTYPVGTLDLANDAPPVLEGSNTALASVAAPEPDGDDVDYFTSTGGSVEVVKAELTDGPIPGRLRARVSLDLREFYFDRFPTSYGKQATGKGALDGPIMSTLASDGDITFTGAFSGRTSRELLPSIFGMTRGEREWGFLLAGPGSTPLDPMGELTIRLARIPAAGETLRFAAIDPDAIYRGPDTASVAMLHVFSEMGRDSLAPGRSMFFISSAGQLRVEAATREAIRGTLTLTLAEYDYETRRATGRTVTATGPVGLALGDAPMLFNRAPAARSLRASRARLHAVLPR
jgi:hypothetical protein